MTTEELIEQNKKHLEACWWDTCRKQTQAYLDKLSARLKEEQG